MQSQQKRVKWSRGETTEALEERTDTGITMASVELMENCIPDMYGNISRRPALSIFDSLYHSSDYGHILARGFEYDEYLQVIPFYITEDDIVLIGIHGNGAYLEFIRIKDNKFGEYVRKNTPSPRTKADIGFIAGSEYVYKPVSFSQQNNYLIVADEYNVYKIQISFNNYGGINPTIDIFKFSAGWYAPYGTQTKQVNNATLPGLNVSGNFASYTYTNSVGDTNVFSWTDTGLDGQANLEAILAEIPLGSIVEFPDNGAHLRVEGYVLDGNNVMIYGALLTPVADSSAHDTRLKVEYGYVDLMPSSYSSSGSYPHPTKIAFSNQRLWAGDWKFNSGYENRYSLIIGSQIAKYTDFENNYNQENEAITLDILTQFKEKIIHLGDFSGLKIMTDAFEYNYSDGTPIKQSANGSLEVCEPIIFDSLCLYVDSTGCQVKAMQYEFQANIFNSSTINQFAPHDLVWYPIGMAAYEDKIHNTGKYLFLKNEESTAHPCLSMCNFVPGNQATIWSRWQFPSINIPNTLTGNIIHNIINTKTQTIFLIKVIEKQMYSGGIAYPKVVPAILNWENTTDFEAKLYTYDNKNYIAIAEDGGASVGYPAIFTLPNTEVAIYANGEFQFNTTTDANGAITNDVSQLTNITAGLPINATIRSHPIDVGGKTKSIKKRIGKARMSVHGTEPGAITINGKTGYMNPAKDLIDFYGVTGMKDEIKYTITNNNGAMFHLESLLMNIEYGTLDS